MLTLCTRLLKLISQLGHLLDVGCVQRLQLLLLHGTSGIHEVINCKALEAVRL